MATPPHPLQVLAWLAAALTFVVTAIKIIDELRHGRKQRASELRWKQAEIGKSLNDEMQTDARAWPALQMLDGGKRDYRISDSLTISAGQDDIDNALNPLTASGESVDFIRDCFDTLFYFLAMLEHYITIGLIREEDVAYPLEYYVPLLAQHRSAVEGYLHHYHLARTLKYLSRHPGWRRPSADAAR